MTSHAAIVARQMGKPCVAGCGALVIDYAKQQMRVDGGDAVLRQGDAISIDGSTGEVFSGDGPTKPSRSSRCWSTRRSGRASPVCRLYALSWSGPTSRARLGVRANADRPEQARLARALGAEGIGLCRTEHMFFEGDRIDPCAR